MPDIEEVEVEVKIVLTLQPTRYLESQADFEKVAIAASGQTPLIDFPNMTLLDLRRIAI